MTASGGSSPSSRRWAIARSSTAAVIAAPLTWCCSTRRSGSGRRRRSAGRRGRGRGGSRSRSSSGGDRVAGLAKARQLGHVDVLNRTGPRPLIAAVAVALRAPAAREAVAVEHLPDRRAGPAHDPRQPRRAEVRLAPGAQDRLLLALREPPRQGRRPARAVEQTAARAALLSTGREPAVPPAMRGRRRHVEGGSCRLQRHPILGCQHQRMAPRHSELGP
jgi:hypothetical protein